MGRKDWYYPNISYEVAERLDEVVVEKGRVYGIENKGELIRRVLDDFIYNYDQDQTKNVTRSSREVNLAPTSENPQTKIDSVNRLLDIMLKHSDEKGCKHTFKEIMNEWYPQRGKNKGK